MWRTYLKGMLIGVADLVPGVSGGTIALFSGVYVRIIDLLSSFQDIVRLLSQYQWRALMQRLDYRFSLPLVAGILTSLVVFARVIQTLYAHYGVLLRAAFLGLVLGAALSLMHLLPRRWTLLGMFLLGALLAGGISQLAPATVAPSWVWLFCAGLLACAVMLLPGISGSLMLLLLGQYEYMLQALVEFNWRLLGVFALGGTVGLFVTARVLRFFLHTYFRQTMALLIGMLIGSVPKLWPWQIDGRLFVPAFSDPLWLQVALCCAAGMVLAWVFRPRSVAQN